MRFFLLRHGQIRSNSEKIYSGRSNEPLTDLGISQAEQAATQCAEAGVTQIIHSPLKRTQQTAEIVAQRCNVPMQADDAFNEFILGPWEGLSEKKISHTYPDAWQRWNCAPDTLELPGRETLGALQERVTKRLMQLSRSATRTDNILIVSHVAIIRVAILASEARPLSEYKRVEVKNCQLDEINYGL